MATSFKGGYFGKLLRVNLSTKSVSTEEIPDVWFEKLLGGRGVAAKIYYNEIGPEVKPFDEENKIILMAGPLTGLPLPAATKFQLSTKSPETGGYLCSNCSGRVGTHLKRCGFDGMVIEGKADAWTYLKIEEGEVSFCDASEMAGKKTSEVIDSLYDVVGSRKAAALTVGPSAERLVKISYVAVDRRALGRGGAGAVFGSKKLKGVVIRGSGEIPVADRKKVDEIRTKAYKILRETRANHTKYGTAQYIQPINELGCMPTRNFQTTYFEGGDQINHITLFEKFKSGNSACDRCPVACGTIAEVKEGPFKGARARTEYENIGILGANCGISDFAAVVAANQLCDELGLDTMSGGNLAALAMELFERGLITTNDTEGIEARFGDGQALLDLLTLFAERRGIGDLFAEGALGILEAHPEWKPYVIHVKGLTPAAYDPRGFYGNALTYGTSVRGACHNVGGWTIRAELQSGQYDRFALEGKGPLVMSIQDNRAYVDSLGICTVVRGSMDFSADPKGETMEAATGYPFTSKLIEIGSRIYSLERMILSREGKKRQDDMLPPRFLTEPVPSGPIKGQVLTEEMYNTLLDEYYNSRGWDNEGVVQKETVESLELTALI